MAILTSFSVHTPELSVSELGQMLGVHDSTASRLAQTLAHWGMLQKNPETGRYRLGSRLIALGGAVQEFRDLQSIARPYMLQLRDLTQETITLTILDGDEALNIDRASGLYMVTNAGQVGRRYPLHCSAAGKVLLVHLPEQKISALISGGLARMTPYTICDEEALREELQRVRTRGFAVSMEEFESGLAAVAAPIWNAYGQVEAALAVAGPVYRLGANKIPEFGGLVKLKAAEISKAMGYVGKNGQL